MRSGRIAFGVVFAATAVFGLLVFPETAVSHGTGYRIVSEQDAVVAEFYYSDGKPISYAKILIYRPDDKTVEYQNGRTDRIGRFAFAPDTAGEWLLNVNDGRGHAVDARVVVGDDATESQSVEHPVSPEVNQPGLIEILFGLSLIMNFCFGLKYYVDRKRRRRFINEPKAEREE